MNINLEYYKVFITIAKNKNITKAANELNIRNVFSRIISNNEIKIAIHPTVLNYFINTKK